MRAILHSDMNAFYCSVEQMLDPSLRGKAVAVCGSTETRHGIVLAKSELAKRSGVKTGMANWEAQRCCPGLIIVPPQYDQYVRFSALAHEIYGRYTDLIEPLGMDECWLDVTGSSRYGTPLSIAEEIRQATKEELGLSVCIGVSFTKIFAKLGSDMKKPDTITCINKENYKTQVWPLNATRKLAARGITTIGGIANCDPKILKSWLGINGLKLWEFANGMDGSRVAPDGYVAPIKSVSHGITCIADLMNNIEVKNVLLTLAPRVSKQLRQAGLKATGVQLFVRDNDLYSREFQCKLPYPTQSWKEMVDNAIELFAARYTWYKPIRAVSIRAINLIGEKLPYQLDLFGEYEQHQKVEALERAVDDLHRRFGDESVFIASTMTAKLKRNKERERITMPAAMYV